MEVDDDDNEMVVKNNKNASFNKTPDFGGRGRGRGEPFVCFYPNQLTIAHI